MNDRIDLPPLESMPTGPNPHTSNPVDLSSIHLQDKDESGSLVLIATDGTQHPPLHFPPGGHLVMFLQCVEASLGDHAHFEPTVEAALAKKEREAEEARERERKAGRAKEDGEAGKEDERKEEPAKPSRRFLPLLRLKRREVSETVRFLGCCLSEAGTIVCPGPRIHFEVDKEAWFQLKKLNEFYRNHFSEYVSAVLAA